MIFWEACTTYHTVFHMTYYSVWHITYDSFSMRIFKNDKLYKKKDAETVENKHTRVRNSDLKVFQSAEWSNFVESLRRKFSKFRSWFWLSCHLQPVHNLEENILSLFGRELFEYAHPKCGVWYFAWNLQSVFWCAGNHKTFGYSNWFWILMLFLYQDWKTNRECRRFLVIGNTFFRNQCNSALSVLPNITFKLVLWIRWSDSLRLF